MWESRFLIVGEENKRLRVQNAGWESEQQRCNSERNKMHAQLKQATDRCGGRFLTYCSNGGRVNSFYFAFTGPLIRPGVMDDKVAEMRHGTLEGDLNYAYMRMFAPNVRCELHLELIIEEYNSRVKPHDRITLRAVEDGNGGYFPLIIPGTYRHNNPIKRKLQADRPDQPFTP
jgi:hypothetical protein